MKLFGFGKAKTSKVNEGDATDEYIEKCVEPQSVQDIKSYDGISEGDTRQKITEVKKGGIADVAGLRVGDILLSYTGMQIYELKDLKMTRLMEGGDKNEVVVLRDGKVLSFVARNGLEIVADSVTIDASTLNPTLAT